MSASIPNCLLFQPSSPARAETPPLLGYCMMPAHPPGNLGLGGGTPSSTGSGAAYAGLGRAHRLTSEAPTALGDSGAIHHSQSSSAADLT